MPTLLKNETLKMPYTFINFSWFRGCNTEQEQEAVYNELDGWTMYQDTANDISYVMDPKAVDKDEYQKAIDAGKEQHIEFLKKNCNFTVQPKHLFNKEKWVYRT